MAKFLVAAGCTAVTARSNPSRALPFEPGNCAPRL